MSRIGWWAGLALAVGCLGWPVCRAADDKKQDEEVAGLFRDGVELYSKGEFDKAIEKLTKALALKKDSAESLKVRGLAHAGKSDFDKSLADFDAAIKLNDKDADAFNQRGDVWHAKHDYDKALADYDLAIKHDPKLALFYNNRGHIWGMHKNDRAKAIADFTKAAEVDPKSQQAFFQRANMYSDNAEYEKAIQDYTKTIELQPKHPLAFSNRANAYFELNQLDKALADYDMSIKVSPENPFGYLDRGRMLFEKKEYPKAIEAFNEAIRKQPTMSLAYLHRGLARETLKDAKAADDFAEAAKHDSKLGDTYYERAGEWYQKGDFRRAVAAFQKTIRLSPKNAVAFNVLSWILSTCPDDNFRDGKLAVELATKACELTSWKDQDSLDTLAAACAEAGKFDDAVKWQAKAVELSPADQKADRDSRLALYKKSKPFREPKRT